MCGSHKLSTIKPKQVRLMVKDVRHTQGATNGVPTIALHHGRPSSKRIISRKCKMKKNKSTSQWNADHKPPIVEQNKKR